MKNFLKHLFVPHEGNGHTPHIFHEATVSALLFVVVFLFGSSFAADLVVTKTSLLGNVYSSVLIDLANADRQKYGVNTLAVSPLLTQAAEMKAQDMASKSYFAHTSPEGIAPWFWFSEVGYTFSYAGENLAVDFQESEAVENAWLASTTHRANILNTKFTEIGIATAKGTYKGRETTYVVQHFGKPKIAKTAPVEITPKKVSSPIASVISTQPIVKGESTEDFVEPVELVPLYEDETFAVVKTAEAEEMEVAAAIPHTPYQSTWIQRLFVNQSHYVTYAYILLFAILVIGLVIYMFHEAHEHRTKHVVYGALLIVILGCLLYLNQLFVLTDKVLV